MCNGFSPHFALLCILKLTINLKAEGHMQTQGINLFIVDDNKLVLTDLKYYLQNRFGHDLNISTFTTGEGCIEKVNKNTNIVILDYFLGGKNGVEILKRIKQKNPKTEVIMLSSNEDVALAVQAFKNGASEYVVKGQGAVRKITKLVYRIVTEPIRILVREFGVSKFMAIFLLTFATVGLVVVIALYFMKS
ncbi:MAG: hypothetical protein K0S53_1881 [Bacteroidetes bacterium]|jgi:ActR/RegA family two-component response regulator|nr:hypothetical protein [Bacteroidota bacterium]MDF2450937.1 hypothetical protein [Bacteroidota bacterium]